MIAAQDMGAAGLTCSSAEMAANGNLGISIDLDLVPSREDDMSPYQYLLSESQERMLFVVKEEKINNLIEKFNNLTPKQKEQVLLQIDVIKAQTLAEFIQDDEELMLKTVFIA